MKALIAILLLTLTAPLNAQPQLLVPIAQDSVPDAFAARSKDGIDAHLKYVDRFTFGDSPFIWFIWPDTSEHTAKDVGFIRVWGRLDQGVEITVATGEDRNNLWVLQPLIQNPPVHGYGYYDFVFATQGNMQASFVSVSRAVYKQNGSLNGKGIAGIDCVEAIPATTQGVQSFKDPVRLPGPVQWYDITGKPYGSCEYMPSGIYLDGEGNKKIVRH
jgi:hypothetical protein